jgi:hypothetical protein
MIFILRSADGTPCLFEQARDILFKYWTRRKYFGEYFQTLDEKHHIILKETK